MPPTPSSFENNIYAHIPPLSPCAPCVLREGEPTIRARRNLVMSTWSKTRSDKIWSKTNLIEQTSTQDQLESNVVNNQIGPYPNKSQNKQTKTRDQLGLNMVKIQLGQYSIKNQNKQTETRDQPGLSRVKSQRKQRGRQEKLGSTWSIPN